MGMRIEIVCLLGSELASLAGEWQKQVWSPSDFAY